MTTTTTIAPITATLPLAPVSGAPGTGRTVRSPWATIELRDGRRSRQAARARADRRARRRLDAELRAARWAY